MNFASSSEMRLRREALTGPLESGWFSKLYFILFGFFCDIPFSKLCFSCVYSVTHVFSASLGSGMTLNGFVSDSVNSIAASDDSPGSDVPPVATICNLGNTCFLNSILYTLRFAPYFLHKLHHLVNDLSDVAARNNATKVSCLPNLS